MSQKVLLNARCFYEKKKQNLSIIQVPMYQHHLKWRGQACHHEQGSTDFLKIKI